MACKNWNCWIRNCLHYIDRTAEIIYLMKCSPAYASRCRNAFNPQVNFMPTYSSHLREIIKKGVNSQKDFEKPLVGFKIAVDAGNGSGGFLANDVLAPLGADTSGEDSASWLLLGKELRLLTFIEYLALDWDHLSEQGAAQLYSLLRAHPSMYTYNHQGCNMHYTQKSNQNHYIAIDSPLSAQRWIIDASKTAIVCWLSSTSWRHWCHTSVVLFVRLLPSRSAKEVRQRSSATSKTA